jgi:hypothetical protein
MYRCSVMYEMYTEKVTVNFSWKKHMDSDAVLGCMLAMLAWQHFEKQKRNKSCVFTDTPYTVIQKDWSNRMNC